MRLIRIFPRAMILVLLLTMATTSAAQESKPKEYEPGELPLLVGDLALNVDLLDQRGVRLESARVDAVTTIRVTEERAMHNDYDLFAYIDRRSVFSKRNVRLPYEFKWDFRGLSEGTHTMMLVFVTKGTQKGIVRLNLSVQH